MGFILNNVFKNKVTITLTIILFFVSTLAIASILINAAVFLIPLGVVGWLGYKFVKWCRVKFSQYGKDRTKNFETLQVNIISSKSHLENEIKNGRVIDVIYTEV